MRNLLGKGTPRCWQGLSADLLLTFLRFWMAVLILTEQENSSLPIQMPPSAGHKDIFVLLAAELETTSPIGLLVSCPEIRSHSRWTLAKIESAVAVQAKGRAFWLSFSTN